MSRGYWCSLICFLTISFNYIKEIGNRIANMINGFLLFAWDYFHGPHTFRQVSIDMLLFIAGLVFFGLLVDLANGLKLGPMVILVLGVFEDGGEMIIISLIVW